MVVRKPAALFLILLFLLLAACREELSDTTTQNQEGTDSETVSHMPLAPLGYTHHRPDGNRFIEGRGALPQAQPLDIPLGGKPLWVSVVPTEEGALWAVVLDSLFTQAFLVEGSEVTPVSITPSVLVDTAPLLTINEDGAHFVTAPINTPGGNHPVRLNNQGDHAFSNASGKLFFLDIRGRDLGIIDGSVLPDGRLLVDENGRLMALANPTEHYDHGVLGDEVEATSIILAEARPEVRVISKIILPELKVVESLGPIWTDWDGDGQREIIVTLSDIDQGAQIVLYSEDGELIAEGPAVGRGYRWRHQIAVAPFGPQGEMELATVLTPHLGGIVEFYQWDGKELNIAAQLPGFTSHVIGSRNLDMAAAADFDGDGHVELLLPDQKRMNLGGIRRTTDGAELVWDIPAGSRISSNLGAVTLSDGQIAVGVGREDDTLRIWQP